MRPRTAATDPNTPFTGMISNVSLTGLEIPIVASTDEMVLDLFLGLGDSSWLELRKRRFRISLSGAGVVELVKRLAPLKPSGTTVLGGGGLRAHWWVVRCPGTRSWRRECMPAGTPEQRTGTRDFRSAKQRQGFPGPVFPSGDWWAVGGRGGVGGGCWLFQRSAKETNLEALAASLPWAGASSLIFEVRKPGHRAASFTVPPTRLTYSPRVHRPDK